MNDRRHSLLRDLERALLEALSESADVHRTLEQMHGAGYRLQLFLDCRSEDEEPAPPGRAADAASAPPLRPGEPTFRINSDDLMMLRALGIDPTRKGRARRSG